MQTYYTDVYKLHGFNFHKIIVGAVWVQRCNKKKGTCCFNLMFVKMHICYFPLITSKAHTKLQVSCQVLKGLITVLYLTVVMNCRV